MAKGEAAFQGPWSHVPFSQMRAFNEVRWAAARSQRKTWCPARDPHLGGARPSGLGSLEPILPHAPVVPGLPRGLDTLRAWASGDLASGAH